MFKYKRTFFFFIISFLKQNLKCLYLKLFAQHDEFSCLGEEHLAINRMTDLKVRYHRNEMTYAYCSQLSDRKVYYRLEKFIYTAAPRVNTHMDN